MFRLVVLSKCYSSMLEINGVKVSWSLGMLCLWKRKSKLKYNEMYVKAKTEICHKFVNNCGWLNALIAKFFSWKQKLNCIRSDFSTRITLIYRVYYYLYVHRRTRSTTTTSWLSSNANSSYRAAHYDSCWVSVHRFRMCSESSQLPR